METFEITQSDNELIKKAKTKTGIQKFVLQSILKTIDMSLSEFSMYINLTPRSIQLKKTNEKLPPVPSEKALLIARVYSKGFEVFGDKEKFIRWMNNKNYVLGGIKPKDYLGSYKGLEILLNEINAIDHGFVV